MAAATVILLTLEQHKNGVWITRLVDAFSSFHQDLTVSVVTLESLLANLDPSAALFCASTRLVVNRVSDAASPHLHKACVGILKLAETVDNIPVWNGPASYSLCSNKWCHHVLFSKAGLESPSTRVLLNSNIESLSQAIDDVTREDDSSETSSVLLKPNASGFGAGVKRIQVKNDLSTVDMSEQSIDETISNYGDCIALVQEYVEADSIYRVWFVRGKVQCGIVRSSSEGENIFTSACMGNTCARRAAMIRAYEIPMGVRNELEEQLLPLLPDAHSGSVEFLQGKNGARLYFDLNLLSTLPLVEQVQDAESVWRKGYDPWKEMADSMMDEISCLVE